MKRVLLVSILICVILLNACMVQPDTAMDKLNIAIDGILNSGYLITYNLYDYYSEEAFCYCYVEGTDYMTYTNISAADSGFINIYYYFKENDRYYLYLCYNSKEFFFDCTELSKEDEKYIPAFKYFFASGVDIDKAIFDAKSGEGTAGWKYNIDDGSYTFVNYLYDISMGEDSIVKMEMFPEVKDDRVYRVTLNCYFYQYELAVPIGLTYTDFGNTTIPEKYKPTLVLSEATAPDFKGVIDYFENNGSADDQVEE